MKLETPDLVALVQRAFAPGAQDRGLAILVDLPDAEAQDNDEWRERRAMAADWAAKLDGARAELGLPRVTLVLYRNARRPNQDLPETAHLHMGGPVPDSADDLAGPGEPFTAIWKEHSIVIAPTEFSATAPLKMIAPRYGLRAATMPGFAASMIPALKVDILEVDRRCRALKDRLDLATGARFVFEAEGVRHALELDLRYRTAHASSGLLVTPGQAGNLPSGETYIVPYEGEREGEPSHTRGTLPVEVGGELFVLKIDGNRVVEVQGEGPAAAAERREIAQEPAYANVSELGLGLLRDYGVAPVGEILLDEKLGLHIAFGRSEHLGGTIGPSAFSNPARVIHLDRVFIPEVMPRIRVREADLVLEDGSVQPLMRDDRYV